MKKFRYFILLTALGAHLVSCVPAKNLTFRENPEIRNVIYIIGDGMGLAHIYAAMSVSNKPLNIERCTVTGLAKTFSANRYITDSAAGGTALATGSKTNNGSVGVDPQGNRLSSILQIAEDNGLATGIICTSSLTDATPASFIAHQLNRDSLEAIARDYLKTDIELFIGGGYDNFAKRSDGMNLADTLRSNGYEVCTSMDMILKSSSGKIAGFIAPLDPPFRLGGRGNMLPSATAKAIEILGRDQDGFFLMVEGSQIDWAAHNHASDTLVDEALDFDEAIGVALDFAMKNGKTLVVVTADHETGGVTITGGDINTRNARLQFSTSGHSAVMVPVYAFGPGSGKFTGIYDNTELFRKILDSYKFREAK